MKNGWIDGHEQVANKRHRSEREKKAERREGGRGGFILKFSSPNTRIAGSSRTNCTRARLRGGSGL